MATSKVRAKGKLKKSIGRLGKMKLGNKEPCDGDTPDLSQLRKPIDISLSSLKQIAQLFEKGSDEVRDILTYECDVVYECRICRSLFRSLANLISHKRVYCLEKCSVNPRRSSTDSPDNLLNVYYNKNNNSSGKRTLVDFDYKENYSNDRILRSQATRKEPKKDLTSVVDMLIKKQNSDFHRNDAYGSKTLRISSDNEQVLLEMMDSNQAAYQTISPSSNDDLMKTQTEELRNMSNRKTAVLGPDGQFHEMSFDVLRSSGERENEDFDFDIDAPSSTSGEDLTCTICNTKFATKKTLTFHVKCKHTPHRIGFPCPCCSSVFTNRWSVYRHLFKVHRKSNVQVRRLRSQIQARAFHRDFSRLEKISKSSESIHDEIANEEQNLTTAQEWMKNLELDAELHRCGACGKRFDRKAALASHSLICRERGEFARRHKRASKNPPQRVESLSSDSSTPAEETTTSRREPIVTQSKPASNASTLEAKSVETLNSRPRCAPIILKPPKDPPEIGIRVEGVSSLSKDVWDMIGNEALDTPKMNGEALDTPKTATIEAQSIRPAIESASTRCANKTPEKTTSDVPEVIYTSIDNSRPVALSVLETEKKLGIQYRGIRLPTVTLEKININAVSRQPATSPRVTLSADIVDKTLSSLTNLRKLQCLPCNRKFGSLLTLKRHIAVHRRRSRYSCKLCDFQAFLKCDFIAHCNKEHDARNNRKTLSELIIEMPIEMNANNRSPATEEARGPKDYEEVDVSRRKAGRPPKVNREKQANETKPPAPIAVDPAVPVKPRRGRPPKSEGRRRKKARIGKKNLRRARHVSPPALNDDFSGTEEIVKINETTPAPPDGEKNSTAKAVSPVSRLRAPSRMECDPALRKMVMEVIFGPAEKPDDHVEANKSGEVSTDDVTIEKLEAEVPDCRAPQDCRILSPKVERVEQESNVASRRSEIQTAKPETMDDRPVVLLAEPANNNVQREKKKPVIISDDVSIVDESTRKNPVLLGRRFVRVQPRDVAHRNSLLLPKPPRDTVRLIILDHGNVGNAATGVRQTNILVPTER